MHICLTQLRLNSVFRRFMKDSLREVRIVNQLIDAYLILNFLMITIVILE